MPKNSSYPKNLATWGDHIRKARLDRGMLQKDVALALGVSETAVSGWEKNWRVPLPALLPRLVAFLGYLPTVAK